MNITIPFHIRIPLKKYWTVLFLVITPLISNRAYTENTYNSSRFNHISVKEGLSQSTIFCITQDHKQFMWFGTRSGGLNRYDSCSFKVFKHDPNDSTTISNNEVISILADHQGMLWIGTRKGGLNRFEEKTETFHRYPTDHSTNSTSGNTINALFQDSKQRIWVCTNAGLDVIIDGKVINHPIPSLENKNISAINEDSLGSLYITDKEALHLFKESAQTIKHYPFPYTNDEINNRNFSGHLYIDQQQQVWLGTPHGLMTFENDSLQYPLEHHNYPELYAETRSILEDQQGHLWFGTLKGLFHYRPQDDQLELYTKNDDNLQSISHSSVYSLFEDNTGIIWIGTWGGGVNMLSSKLYKFQHFVHQSYNKKSLSNNSVSSFLVDQNGLWVGTESGGLNFRAHNSFEFERITHPNLKGSDHIKTLLKSKSNRIYIGSFNGGLHSLHLNTHKAEHIIPKEKVFALAENPTGIIWAGTINGLYCYNEKTKALKHYVHKEDNPHSISHNFIDVLFTSSDGALWVGAKEGGLMRYSQAKDQFTRFRHQAQDSTSLLSDYIISLEEDKNGNLLVGTSNGINVFNSVRQNFEELNISLPDKNINGIVCDQDNNYWIATNKGITKYAHHNTPVNYDINDGLQSNEFNRNACYQDQQGNIYFGGINGFNVFHPEQVPINTIIPEIKITNLKLSNQDITPSTKNSPLTKHITETKNIVLNHDQNDFSFEFVSLNYIVPQKNQYAYKLIGYNNDWIYCGNQRVANYTNLKPGNYTFMVKGSNNDNIWNEKGTALHIHIKQPFWKTPIAYALYLFVISSLFFILRWLISMRLEQQNLLKIERLEKEQIEELNQIKLRFFTNVAHEFRTPLTLIAGPLQEIKDRHTKNDNDTYLLKVIQNNVKRLLLLVDELLDFRKAGNNKIQLHATLNSPITFIENIMACFRESTQKKNITLEFDHPLEYNKEHYFDLNVMDKVIFNLLSNALKYTPYNGKINIILTEENQGLTIKVKDSGKGIAQSEINKIFDRFYQGENQDNNFRGSGIGLAYAKRLTEAHHGQISVNSTVNIGTTFTVSIPTLQSEYNNSEQKENKKTSVSHAVIDTAITPNMQHAKKITSPYHILIVEDNKELNQYLSYYFRAYKITSAQDGEEGYKQATKDIPDLIISDIMMPKMNGLEMCKELKDQFLTSHIPIILLTAKSEKEHKIEGLQYGADAYIEKPFNTQLLEVSVKNLLHQREKLKVRLSDNKNQAKATNALNKHDQRFIEVVNKTIQEELHNSAFSIEDLSEKLGMSRSQLFRKFKALYPHSPNEVLRLERLNYAKRLIEERNYNINEISELAGFSSTSYFTTSFKKHFGITPTEHAKKPVQ